MSGHRCEVRIRWTFPIRDQQEIYAHLESFEWDFSSFGPVEIRAGGETIRVRYVGCGNIEGEPVVVLVPDDPKYNTVEEVHSKIAGRTDVCLVRASD